jgi:hypothetical protein
MAFTASIGNQGSNCTNVYAQGTIYHNTGIVDTYGIEINGVKTQKGTTPPVGYTYFNHNFTGSYGTTYTMRTYGHVYGGSYFYSGYVSVTPVNTPPSLTTTTPTGIAAFNAVGIGNVTSAGCHAVTSRGLCWSTSANPTTADPHVNVSGTTGSFTGAITGLLPTTLYHVRAFAMGSSMSYGNDVTFTTKTPPTVTITTITDATDVLMLITANVTLSGSGAVSARGICWGSIANPTISGNHTTNGSGLGAFTGTITGLTYPQIYFVRAYATNSYSTAYSQQKTVMALAGEVIYSGYTSSGTLVIPTGKNFTNYLIVGGGAGGGNAKGSPPFAGAYAGGGGGGGLLSGIKHLSTTGGTFAVVVGNGGAPNAGGGVGAGGGQSSVFGLIAYGGGAGACSGDIYGFPWEDGFNGANGGGGGSYTTIGETFGGNAVHGPQGHDGGDGSLSYPFEHGGGGGGYLTAGSFDAGSGITLNYSGQLILYSRGGTGISHTANGASGLTNSGQGGGGAGQYVTISIPGQLYYGGAGGKGVIYTLAGFNPWLMDTPTFTIINILSGCTLYAKATIDLPNFHNVGYYRLERSTTSGGTYTVVATGSTGGTQIIYDQTPVYGSTYWYKVVAVNQYMTEDSAVTNLQSTVSLPNAPVLNAVLNVSAVDLSWTDANLFHNKHQVYRRDLPSVTYNLKATVTGNTYTDSTITYGHEYRYKIREEIDCFAPTYIYSPYSNEANIYINALLIAPTGISTVITCTGVTINWVNNNVSGQTGNYIKEWNGTGYTIIATLSSGSSTYHITGLTPISSYIYIVAAYNSSQMANSADINVTTQDPTPFNINVGVSYLTAPVTWSINDPPYGTAIRPEIRVSGDTSWTTKPLLVKNAVSYTYTGLSFNTNYEGRLVRIGTEYPSIIFGFPTTTFLAPDNLIITSVGDKQICLQWQNHSVNDNIGVWYRKEAEVWQLYQTITNTNTTICVTGLSMQTLYTFAVLNNYGIYSLSSNQVQATTTVAFLPPFCEAGGQFSITGATCGNSDGIIAMAEDYTIFYNFTLEDAFGTFYTLTDYYWTGLTAGWYKITATVKPQWYTHYGNDDCIIDWIALPDTNTTLSLFDTKIKNAVCGGFGSGKGRIVYQFYDSDTGNTIWDFILFNNAHQIVNTQSGLSGITAIQYSAQPDDYYGMIQNQDGCRLLFGLTQVGAEKLWTVEGIQRLFLTPWSASTSYDYYDNTSDDWYVAGIDTQQFTSTKIARYNNLSDFWYEIRLQTAVMTYGQSLQKGSNGLTYQETINISIPHADNAKWKQLVNVLSQRYIIVFQDNNGNWWTSFYRNGAEVKAYQLSENQYNITFQHPSVNKMLTAIDYAYVKLNIL